MKFKKVTTLVIACLGLAVPVVSQASTTFSNFTNITNNSSIDLSSQLQMDVSASGSDVLFKIFNNVGVQSSVTAIYFDQGVANLLSNVVMNGDSGLGVSFDSSASPANVPGGNTIAFTADWNGDSNAKDPTCPKGDSSCTGTMANGLNAYGEWVSFLGTLSSGTDLDHVLADLSSGSFRVGMHVQAIGTAGQSDSYVSVPPVPLPAAAWLFGSALLGFVMTSSRRRV